MNRPHPSFFNISINHTNVGCQHKSSVDILGAAGRPRSSSSISNVRNNCNFNKFNSKNNDFRVGLTSVQGKLELLDSFNSKSSFDSKNNFSISKRWCTCTSSCIYDMINDSNSDV